MLNLFKKTLAVCLIGFGLRSFTSNITSIFRMAICYRSYNSCSWNCMAFVLIILGIILKIKESA